MFGASTWEAAESTMQKEATTLAIGKAGLKPADIRLLFVGDLLAQTAASSFGAAGMGIPFYGLFSACSTMGEASPVRPLHCCRIRRTYPVRNFQPLLQCGKRIPFSPGLRKSKALICYLDSYRCRRLCTWQPASSPCIRKIPSSALRTQLHCHYRPDNRQTGGLRTKRFHEHGRLYGSRCL